MFKEKFIEKIKTHILCAINFIFTKMVLIFRKGGKHMAELDRPQTTMQYVACGLCWATKATDTYNQNMR